MKAAEDIWKCPGNSGVKSAFTAGAASDGDTIASPGQWKHSPVLMVVVAQDQCRFRGTVQNSC